jgi:hypothetical protein
MLGTAFAAALTPGRLLDRRLQQGAVTPITGDTTNGNSANPLNIVVSTESGFRHAITNNSNTTSLTSTNLLNSALLERRNSTPANLDDLGNGTPSAAATGLTGSPDGWERVRRSRGPTPSSVMGQRGSEETVEEGEGEEEEKKEEREDNEGEEGEGDFERRNRNGDGDGDNGDEDGGGANGEANGEANGDSNGGPTGEANGEDRDASSNGNTTNRPPPDTSASTELINNHDNNTTDAARILSFSRS